MYNQKNKKILLIDDNPGDAFMLNEAIKRIERDIDHDVCESGKDSLALLEKQKANNGENLPHLIILDLNMPGLDGTQVLNQLKKDGDLKFIPVVMMTTSSLRQDVERCYLAGANSVIVKPMDFYKYVDILNLLATYWFDTVKSVRNG